VTSHKRAKEIVARTKSSGWGNSGQLWQLLLSEQTRVGIFLSGVVAELSAEVLGYKGPGCHWGFSLLPQLV